MTFVKFFLLFIIGGALGALWFTVIILPIFYGLPRSLYWIDRKTLKAKAVLFYLGTFVFWTAIFTGTAFVLTIFFPSVAKYLYNSPGFYYGQWLGVIGALIRAFSKSGRKHLSDDFWAAMAKYKKHSDEAIKRSDLVKRGLDLIDEVKKRQVEVPTDHEKKALEGIIFDCEMHRLQDLNMFSSMTDFYKFMDTEVQYHAKKDGLDIGKAKEAYISWAKKKHSAEYDKLFMGFFNEILDGKKTISRQELMVRLEGVDFRAAAENIAYTIREAAKTTESEGGQYIAKKEFMDAADHYIEKPCLERAITLLEKYPLWLGLFELTKDPLQIKIRDFKKSKK